MGIPRITLTPAYGRDYASKAAIKADLLAGKDFILNQFGSVYDGKPCTLLELDLRTVEFNVRYSKLRKVAVFRYAELEKELNKHVGD